MGRGGAGERPHVLWCCGGTCGLAAAQERAAGAWASGFVKVCGSACTAQGGGRMNGKVAGGFMALESKSKHSHKHKHKHKHNYTQAHAQALLHTRTSSL